MNVTLGLRRKGFPSKAWAPDLLLRSHDSLAGYFKLTAVRPDGRRRPLTGWIPNIITDSGMENFGYGGSSTTDPNGWMAYCRVGTGSTAPSVSNGDLDNTLAEAVSVSRTNGTSAQTGPPHYRWQRDIYVFPPGSATGIIAEVGLGRKIANGNLSTRALVVDELGDPATVPVLADEQLEVVYEIRTYITNVTPQNSTMTIDGVLYDTIRLPMNIDSSTNMNGTFNYGAGIKSCYLYRGTTLPNIGGHYEEPINLMLNQGATRLAYGSGLFYRDSTCFLDTDDAEYGDKGITAIGLIGYLSWWQMSFTQRGDPTWGIPHNNTNQMFITLRHSWDRYTP